MTATPIPSARITFSDSNGIPLVGGSVLFCTPGTLAKKVTWTDASQEVENANPLTLDALGQAAVWGVGGYRQLVYDAQGVLIWDDETIASSSFGQVNGSDLTASVNSEINAQVPGLIGPQVTSVANTIIPGLIAPAISAATPGIITQATAAAPVQSVNGQTGAITVPGASFSPSTPAALSASPTAGTSASSARADHSHALPTASAIGAATPTSVNTAIGATSINGTALTPGGNITVSGGINQLSGDVTTPTGQGAQPATLATVNSAPGTVGDAATVPVITVDAKGRTTSVGSATITPTSVGALAAGGTAVASDKLSTARNIILGGDLSGQIAFDGSGDVTLSGTQAKFGRRYDAVISYAADASGATDSTTALQNAVNAATSAGGGRVWLQNGGKFLIGGTVTLPPNVCIESDGTAVVIPNAGSVAAFKAVNASATAMNIALRRFKVKAAVAGAKLLNLKLAQFVQVSDLDVAGVDIIVQGDQVDTVTITRVRNQGLSEAGFTTRQGGGFQFYSSSGTNYSSNVTLRDVINYNIGNSFTRPSIVLARCVGAVLDGCGLNDGRNGGLVDFIDLLGDCQGCLITDCGMGTGQTGIYSGYDTQFYTGTTQAPSFISVTGFNGDQPQSSSINIAHGTYWEINGCKLTSSGTNPAAQGLVLGAGTGNVDAYNINFRGGLINGFSDATSGIGIYIRNTATDIIVSDTQVVNCGNGSRIESGANYVQFSGNNLRGCSTPTNFGTVANFKARGNFGLADSG